MEAHAELRNWIAHRTTGNKPISQRKKSIDQKGQSAAQKLLLPREHGPYNGGSIFQRKAPIRSAFKEHQQVACEPKSYISLTTIPQPAGQSSVQCVTSCVITSWTTYCQHPIKNVAKHYSPSQYGKNVMLVNRCHCFMQQDHCSISPSMHLERYYD